MSKEFWDQRYSEEGYAYGIEPNAYFKSFIDAHEEGRIFLPGEGEGRNAVYAARKGWEVTAVDQSTEARNKALKLANRYDVKINYEVLNLTEIGVGREDYDAVALVFVHLPPDMRSLIHHQLITWLKPGGCLIVESFHKNQLGRETGGPQVLELLYDEQMLREDFKDLQIIEIQEKLEIFDEGPYHQGKAAIIRLTAQR